VSEKGMEERDTSRCLEIKKQKKWKEIERKRTRANFGALGIGNDAIVPSPIKACNDIYCK